MALPQPFPITALKDSSSFPAYVGEATKAIPDPFWAVCLQDRKSLLACFLASLQLCLALKTPSTDPTASSLTGAALSHQGQDGTLISLFPYL